MTDYIEALLQEQEPARTEDLTWRVDGAESLVLPGEAADGADAAGGPGTAGGTETGGPGGRPAAARGWGALALRQAGGLPEGERSAAGGGDIEALGSADLDAGGAETAQGAGETAALFLREAAAAGMAGLAPVRAAAGDAAAWADRALRESLAAQPARPPAETRVAALRPAGPGGAAWGPEGLDRAFRRDARRFDGGFQLL